MIAINFTLVMVEKMNPEINSKTTPFYVNEKPAANIALKVEQWSYLVLDCLLK